MIFIGFPLTGILELVGLEVGLAFSLHFVQPPLALVVAASGLEDVLAETVL